ncbi:three-helix bundle dimerization domain-containing protein [Microbacterium pumilum]|uniref:Protein-tyrosine-phosphatase-like N-terminal domain-containing protein n=1 Tax=Microbacterium pumilum TaxID=344165 RepID=A0ABP5D4R8_9MICO
MTHEPPDADTTITEIVERLGVRFPAYPTSTIRDVVTESYNELNDAHVRDFVEVLVEKQAKKRLKHLDA